MCGRHRGDLFKADVLIASDGPRIAPQEPTIFLGARGGYPIDLFVDLREGSHHSGNWGGLLANAGIVLAQALASITDARGAIRVPEWRPPLPQAVRDVLAGVEVDGGEDGPTIDRDWGEPGLTPAERVFAGTASRFSAFTAGTPERPVNAIPGTARAHCQLDTWSAPTSTTSFRRCGGISTATAFGASTCGSAAAAFFHASRLDPADPWVDLDEAIDRAHDRARADHLCPISAARCRTTFSPTCST